MPEIYLIRHGETDYNRKGIVQGRGIDAPLNQQGHHQAEAFFRFYRQVNFDAIYQSELQRTHQTLFPWLDHTPPPQIEAGLNELHWGALEGKVPTSEEKQAFRDTIQAWTQGQSGARLQDGESADEAWQRCEAFFGTLPDRHPESRLLICSHGRQIRVILSMLLYGDLRHMELFAPHNTALFILRLKAGFKGKATLLNDIRHIDSIAQIKDHTT